MQTARAPVVQAPTFDQVKVLLENLDYNPVHWTTSVLLDGTQTRTHHSVGFDGYHINLELYSDGQYLQDAPAYLAQNFDNPQVFFTFRLDTTDGARQDIRFKLQDCNLEVTLAAFSGPEAEVLFEIVLNNHPSENCRVVSAPKV